MSIGRLLLPLAVASFPLVLAAAEPPADGLSVVLRCAACEAAVSPHVELLWRGTAEADAPSGSLQALDWAAGRFALVLPTGRTEMQAQRLEDGTGWRVEIALGAAARPFRLVGTLEGFAAARTAWWPERDSGPYVIDFEPMRDVLQANPAWDPATTGECAVLVPKSAPVPVTFFVEGQPRAWLHPADPAADGTPTWSFQFVRPGQSLLERVDAKVPAFDEGEAWSFRLPLEAVLSDGAVLSTREGGFVNASPQPADEVRIAGGGTIRLGDCPRRTR